jgi:outer membrane protein assembly factor BamB
MIKRAHLLFPAAALAFWVGLAAHAEDWPQWRGPHFNGSSEEKNLPSAWTKESVLWGTDLPGAGASTPAILGNLIFITAPDVTSDSLRVMCLDRATGKVLWNKQAEGASIRRDERSNFASPSPAADADRVVFFFGNGTLCAFDHKGTQLWSRNIAKDYGEFAFNWTFSTSPVLYAGKLYLQVLQRDVPVHGHGRTDAPIDSFLLAMDPATGKTLWQHVRPTDAKLESHESYSTPIPFEQPGRRQILVLGGDFVTGHDPDTGAEIWRSPNLNPTKKPTWPQISSPVTGAGLVLMCQPQKSWICALKPDGTNALPDASLVWNGAEHKEVGADVPTPAFYDHDFFVVADLQKNLFRVDAATGKLKWSLALGGPKKFEASPTLADGKIYLMNYGGEVVVVDAAKGEILSRIAMGDEGEDITRASIAVAGGRLFIRTNHKLYCVAKNDPR